MQDTNLRIAFDYKYPDQLVLLVYEAFRSSIFGVEDSVRIRKTITGDEAVKTYSQLTGKSIPDIHMEAGNPNWGAFDYALAKRQLNDVKIKTNNKDFSRKVIEAEELSRKILESGDKEYEKQNNRSS